MYRFRLLILVIIIWLVLILNIERPDNFLGLGNINLSPITYILIIITMVTIIFIPELNRVPLVFELALLLAVYWLLKFKITYSRTLVPSENYIVFAEFTVISVTLWFSRQVSQSLIGFETALDKAVLGFVNTEYKNLTFNEQAITSELQRARRYERIVALLYVQFEAESMFGNGVFTHWNREAKLKYRYRQTNIMQIVRDLLLEPSDIITWHKKNMVICLPDTDQARTNDLAQNLKVTFEEILEITITIGIAYFPEDALVWSELITAARRHQQRDTKPLNKQLV